MLHFYLDGEIRQSETNNGFDAWQQIAENDPRVVAWKQAQAAQIMQTAAVDVIKVVEKYRKAGVVYEQASHFYGVDSAGVNPVRKMICSANGQPQADGIVLYGLPVSLFNEKPREWRVSSESGSLVEFIFANKSEFEPLMETLAQYTLELEARARLIVAEMSTLAQTDLLALYNYDMDAKMLQMIEIDNLQKIPDGWQVVEGSRILQEV